MKLSSFLIKSVYVVAALVASVGSRISYAAEVNHAFAKLENAVLDGKDIRMALDLSKCVVKGSGKPGPSIRGSLHFDGYMIEQDLSISFATTHFTLRKDNTPVDEFLSFKVLSTGEVLSRTRFVNPSTYAVFHEAEFDCQLDRGVVFHW